MSNFSKKVLLIIITLTIIPFSLTGCKEDAEGIENLAYVTAIGFDVGKENILTLTLQFANLTSTAQSGSSQPETASTVSVDCASFTSGLSLIGSYISRKINLSHCKIIVFSEELAVRGISNQINTLTANIEIRPDSCIFISKCNTEKFLKDSVPSIGNLTTRYYQILLNSKEYTGFSDNTPLWKFYIDIKNYKKEPIAVLYGLNSSYRSKNISNYDLMDKDVNYKAGDAPITGRAISQNMGLAVFSNDKMVGELTAIECISYLMLNNSLDNCELPIPNPFEKDSLINIKLKLDKNTKNKIALVNGSPFIESDVFLEGSITSVNISSDYSKNEHLKIIEEYVSSYVEANLNSFLYKTSKQFKSDIVGFGEKLLPNYLEIKDWEKIKWTSLYKDSFFKVNVKTTIKSGALFVKN